uniref:Uncharacterized protein LOC107430704 n=2 Tax=Rhizophora mucronata TaxID=61149 RepID=A0A2P2IW35_RHIMU
MVRLRLRGNHDRRGMNEKASLVKGGQSSKTRSPFGSPSNYSHLLVWLKGLALDPCNPKTSERSARNLWNRALWLRKFLELTSYRCPRRKQKLQHFLKSSKIKGAPGMTPQKPSIQNGKDWCSQHFCSLPNSADTYEHLNANTVLNSCNSDSMMMFEDTLQAKKLFVKYSSQGNQVNLGPSNKLFSLTVNEDESTDGSEFSSSNFLITKEAAILYSDSLVHSIVSTSNKDFGPSVDMEESADDSKGSNHGNLLDKDVPIVNSDDLVHAFSNAAFSEISSPLTSTDESFDGSNYLSLKTLNKGIPIVVLDDLINSVDWLKPKKCKSWIPVGPEFQAEIPDWTGPTNIGTFYSNVDSESLKWLGTRDWPTKGTNTGTIIKAIGMGRPNSCPCASPGSIECIKHHVHEANRQLRSDLGPAFFSWKFNEMGEAVSRSWKLEEKKQFQFLVEHKSFNHEKEFWKLALKRFPSKSLRNILSYYYNVFVPERVGKRTRRHFRDEVDSDDDITFMKKSRICRYRSTTTATM